MALFNTFKPSAQQLKDLQRVNQARSQGNFLLGGNIGASAQNTPQIASYKAGIATPPTSGVLGVGTSSGGGGNSQLDQLSKTDRNPAQETDYQNLLRQRGLLETPPPEPSFDETPFNQLIDQINSLGGVFRSDYETAQKGIEQKGQQELAELEGTKTEAEQNLAQYKTEAEQDVTKNIDEQRRQFSEIQQGIQSRYGRTTGTGAFASELVGRDVASTIGNFRQNLQNEYSKVNQIQGNLYRTFMSEKTKIEQGVSQLKEEARNRLNKELADIEIQKGQIGLSKQQRKQEAISQYQNVVGDINARNTNYLRQLDEQKRQLEQSLQAQSFKMSYNATNAVLKQWQDYVKSGDISVIGVKQAESALGLPPGTVMSLEDKLKLEQQYGGSNSNNKKNKKINKISGIEE